MFEAKQQNIYDTFTKTMFDIPRNQRKYVWNEKNWKDILEDILFSEKTNNSHFIGSVVLKKEKEINNIKYFSIIDGQQRIMTITILLIVLMYKLKENNNEDLSNGIYDLLFPKNSKSKEHFILVLEKYKIIEKIANDYNKDIFYNVLQKYKDRNANDRIIYECFCYFYQECDDSNIEIIINKLYEVLCIIIIANNDEDAYTIFEVLNARGVELKPSEKLKNYIFRYILPQENVDCAKAEWDDLEKRLSKNIDKYLKHYVKHKYLSDKKSTDTYDIIKLNNSIDKTNELFDDILKKSYYYAKICNPIKENIDGIKICTDKEYKIFKFFKENRQEIFRPLLLSFMSAFERKIIDEKLYNENLLYLYKFFILYTLIGKEKSNRLTDIVDKYSYILENDFKPDLLEDIRRSFVSRIPNELWLINVFKTIGYSHKFLAYHDEKMKKQVELALGLYEGYLNNDEFPNFDFTLEHILDDANDENNAMLGNLLPLEDNLNQECIGKNYNEKLLIYKKSKYKLARNFAEKFTREEDFSPIKRSEFLAKEIYSKIINIK